jgi:hypothetical protein
MSVYGAEKLRKPLGSMPTDFDPWLVAAVLLAFAFIIHGIGYGRTTDWNPDQLALVDLFDPSRPPLQPKNFHKPALLSYFHLIFTKAPVAFVDWLFSLSQIGKDSVTLIWARTLSAGMFAGTVVAAHAIAASLFGQIAARVTALLLATSAGLAAFGHYLTTDIPLTFSMALALFFALRLLRRPDTRNYLLAGCLAGMAMGVKYNGVLSLLAVYLAHLSVVGALNWRCWMDRRIGLALFAAVACFVIGNPYSVILPDTFVSDFMYNLRTTPVYQGEQDEHSYLEFVLHLVDMVGLPVFVLTVLAVPLSVWLVWRGGEATAKHAFTIILIVCTVYYLYFGSFTYLPLRYVMPIVPLWLLLAAPIWQHVHRRSSMVVVLMVPLLIYNIVCSWLVGTRFDHEPRMQVQTALADVIPPGSSIEYSPYAFGLEVMAAALNLKMTIMPSISGRSRMFMDKLGDDRWVVDRERVISKSEPTQWYSEQALIGRNPDFVAIDSLYFGRFAQGTTRAGYYPEIARFFDDLLNERMPYRIVFDARTEAPPWWVYPKDIEFLWNRMVVLRRADKER